MKKFKWDKKYLHWGVTAFLVIVACMVFYTIIQQWPAIGKFLGTMNGYLAPFLWGFVLAYLLTPVVKLLQGKLLEPLGHKMFKKGDVDKKAFVFGRAVSIAVALIVLFALIAVLLWQVVPQMYNSIEGIITNLSSGLQRFEAWSTKWLDGIPWLKELLQGVLGDVGTTFTDFAKNNLLPNMQDIASSVFTTAAAVVGFIVNLVVAVVVSVYLMYNKEKFIAQCRKLLYTILNAKHAKSVLTVVRFTDKSFIGFITGKLLDAFIVGIIVYIGCLIFGLKDAVLIAILMGVCNIIPFFGPFIGAVPSALIVLLNSTWVTAIIFVIFIMVVTQIDGNIIGPKILGASTGLTSFWILFAIMFGLGLFGPIGVIIGVPFFAVVYAGIKWLVDRVLKKKNLPVATEEYYDLYFIDPETGEKVEWEYPDPEEEKERRRESREAKKADKAEEKAQWTEKKAEMKAEKQEKKENRRSGK